MIYRNSITINGEMYLLIGWFGWGEHLYLFCILVYYNKYGIAKSDKCGKKQSETRHLFKYPKNAQIKGKWISFGGKQPTTYSVSCSDLFQSSDLKKTNR